MLMRRQVHLQAAFQLGHFYVSKAADALLERPIPWHRSGSLGLVRVRWRPLRSVRSRSLRPETSDALEVVDEDVEDVVEEAASV